MNRSIYLALATWLTSFTLGNAGDWPQVLGPNRDGVSADESEELWNDQPKIKWQIDCGSGFAGVSVVKKNVFVFDRIGDEQRVRCLTADEGKQRWESKFSATFSGGYSSDHGPRCVPIINNDRVFVYGAAGELRCLDANSGETIWARALRDDYAAEDGYFGAGSTPIVIAGVVVTAVGGIDGTGVVAVDRKTGKTRWTATDLEADYASPIALDHDTAIVPMRMKTVAIGVEKGDVEFEIPFGQRGLNVIGTTPTLVGDRLLLSASYRIGSQMLDLSQSPPKIVWSGDDILSSQYNAGIVHDGFVYGIHGREDMGKAELRCVELADGKVQWVEPDFGVAHLIGIGDRLITQRIDGTLDLLQANPKTFRTDRSFALPRGVYRALPALSGGILFCRRSEPDGKLIAVQL